MLEGKLKTENWNDSDGKMFEMWCFNNSEKQKKFQFERENNEQKKIEQCIGTSYNT